MTLARRFNNMLQRSNLIRNIETSKRKLLNASDQEKMKYELQLLAFRQQVRLLDGYAER